LSEYVEGIRQYKVIKVFIPTWDNDSLKSYEGYGNIKNVWYRG